MGTQYVLARSLEMSNSVGSGEVALSPDGRQLAFLDGEHITVMNLETGTTADVYALTRRGCYMRYVTFQPRWASAGLYGALKIILAVEVETRTLLGQAPTGGFLVAGGLYHPDSSLLVVGDPLRLIDLADLGSIRAWGELLRDHQAQFAAGWGRVSRGLDGNGVLVFGVPEFRRARPGSRRSRRAWCRPASRFAPTRTQPRRSLALPRARCGSAGVKGPTATSTRRTWAVGCAGTLCISI